MSLTQRLVPRLRGGGGRLKSRNSAVAGIDTETNLPLCGAFRKSTTGIGRLGAPGASAHCAAWLFMAIPEHNCQYNSKLTLFNVL